MYEVITNDGRTLAVEEWGVPDGTAVVYCHGTPMSRLARYPDDELFGTLGIRLITYDRPGYGKSTPQRGRRVADAAADIEAIASALSLNRFPVFGVSGGGGHALAAAAGLPDRVTAVGVMACTAPRDAAGLDWTAGMMEDNQASSVAAANGREALADHLAKAESSDLMSLVPPAEQAVLQRPDIQRMLSTAFAEALRPGLDGWIDDERALYALPWGFDPSTIRVPVRLWHGELDTLVPVSHSVWLAERIPDALLVREPTAAHAGHFLATPDMLRWLVATEG
ncbi:alpha/beta fold hydrolase [Phytoactinopolyspora limicola]|uniref:alpha/beta fold hydrolase n=1 Tax=Phytoactinopolyspora limicola TaxID=2715536 RepID=UPI00140D0F8E|nr:alpha/beta hydrolase [Phytoactinopolyspora limicola]